VIDLAIEDRVLDRSGTWLSFGEVRLGQGREKARAFLEENQDILANIKQRVLEARGYAHKPEPQESNGHPAE
jgi:recombination protein RecA